MSLKDWLDNGWLKPHQTNRQEISYLLEITERDLTDASSGSISWDWQFGIAYNAALKLCTIVLYAQGYRPENTLAHYRTIMALKEVEGQDWARYAAFLNSCRSRRNTLEYVSANTITASDVAGLVSFAKSFLIEVKDFLRLRFPELLAPSEPRNP